MLVIFYGLLPVLSEQMPCNAAYGITEAAIAGLITAHVGAVIHSRRPALITGGVLLLVYGFLLTLIPLQGYLLF